MAIRQFFDNDQRATQRIAVHLLEQRQATIRARDTVLKTRIVDFSPFGIGVVLDGPSSRVVFLQGETVTISVIRNHQEIEFQGLLVTKGKMTIMGETYTRLGFKIAATPTRQHIGNARKNKRFALSEVVELTCHCEDPMNEGQRAFFTVEDLSATGLALSTSSRNKFILPQMRLKMDIVIPGEGNFPEELIVRHIRPTAEGDRYILGCEFARPHRKTLEALADFCLSFGKQSSYQVLIDEGFPLAFNSSALTVHITESEQDFMQIMVIRLKDAHWKGQLLKIKDPRLTGDEHDEYARHICVKVGSRVVAAGRLVFNNGDRSRSTFDPSFELPSYLWKDGFVAVSKMAVDPDFHGSMAFVRLWNEVFRVAFLSGVRYMTLLSSRDWPLLLQNFGLQKTGVWHGGALFGEELIILDIEAVMKGKGASFSSWAMFAAPLVEKIQAESQVSMEGKLALKLKLAKLLRVLLNKRLAWEGRLKKNPHGKQGEISPSSTKDSGREVA